MITSSETFTALKSSLLPDESQAGRLQTILCKALRLQGKLWSGNNTNPMRQKIVSVTEIFGNVYSHD